MISVTDDMSLLAFLASKNQIAAIKEILKGLKTNELVKELADKTHVEQEFYNAVCEAMKESIIQEIFRKIWGV